MVQPAGSAGTSNTIPPVLRYGTSWHTTKKAMKHSAALRNAQCEMAMMEDGRRYFGCYTRHEDAYASDALAQLPPHQRHVNEIITSGRPVKPYLDVDADSLPQGYKSTADLARAVVDAVVQVFKEDYKKELAHQDCHVFESPKPDKVSFHVVVSSHNPQYVYRSNHQDDEQGAVHLAMRVRQLLPGLLDTSGKHVVDASVYTKDREMRLPYSTKHTRPESVLVPMCLYTASDVAASTALVPTKDMFITGLDDDIEQLTVPIFIPRNVLKGSKVIQYKDVQAACGHALRTHSCDHPDHVDAFVRGRMLELLQAGIHPTAYSDRSHGEEDAYNPELGIKFNYSDRNEACYSGCVHDGTQNLRCWVYNGGIFMKCYSDNCNQQRGVYLGPLHTDSDAWQEQAVNVNMRYLDPTDLDFSTILQQWKNKKFKVLSLRSAMGTGKTTLLQYMLEHMFPGCTVLVVTYRVTLAHEFSRKLKDHGFTSYLDVNDSKQLPLEDRDAYPRVICQLESLHRLGRCITPQFDLVVIDEVSSVLGHIASPTMRAPLECVHLLQRIMHRAGHVFSADAYWGAAAHAFFSKCSLSQRVVINQHRAPQRTFIFEEDNEQAWQSRIIQELRDGHNVVVASMSTNVLYNLTERAITAGVVTADKVICHTSKSDDKLKQGLQDVEAMWSQYSMVAYSPTIEAGVDFSAVHFHSMHVYACFKSTTPLGLTQMTGRVRTLGSPIVHVSMSKGMLKQNRPRITVQEARTYVRYLHKSMAALSVASDTVVWDGETGRELWLALPPEDVMFEIAAHNEAAAANKELRFFLEVQDMLLDGGHEVVVVGGSNAPSDGSTSTPSPRKQATSRSPTKAATPSRARKAASSPGPSTPSPCNSRAGSPPGTPCRSSEDGEDAEASEEKLQYAARMLLAAPDIDTYREWADLRGRIINSNASEADKWANARHLIKTFYAVDTIDEAFLLGSDSSNASNKQAAKQQHRTNRTQPYCPKLMLLMRMLYPTLYRTKELAPAQQSMELMARHVSDVLAAMGFASPFDVSHQFTQGLDTVYREKLQHTEMFKQYDLTSVMFKRNTSSSKKQKQWDSAAVAKAVGMVLSAVGLKLDCKRNSKWDKEAKASKQDGPPTYSLSAQSVQTMAELVKLKTRRSGSVNAVNAHAQAYLQDLQLSVFSHLVKTPTNPNEAWRGGDGRDDGAC